MKLSEALRLKNSPGDALPFPVCLACGFTPLHLSIFLAAYLRQRLPDQPVDIRTGLYDDLGGTLSAVESRDLQGLFVQLEWPDLDPRLGLRQLGGWSPAKLPEIAESAERKLKILEQALYKAADRCPVVLSPPLLEMPPLFYTTPHQLHPYAAEIGSQTATFVARAASRGIRILNTSHLPDVPRFDVRSYLTNGFPYQLEFTSALAHQMVNILLPPVAKKGVITDLDNTLWSGILGEVGVASVSWDLTSNTQIHGIYQVLLQSLADAGVLVAVATKNDLNNVREAMERADLLISPRSVFPVEAGWGPKSESVARILKAWNISQDAVVFVDDSPMELAQVASAFPSMTTLLFPSGDVAATWSLLCQLRGLFGKSTLSQDDSIRALSLRNATEREQAFETGGAGIDEFLAHSEAVVDLEMIHPEDARALELVNKTNQFNLNGQRWTEAEWRRLLADGCTLALAVTYEDKYGRLGKIAVMAGSSARNVLRLRTWVMSCRAFSRRIEHQCLRTLFDCYQFDRIELEFIPTARNGPIQEFLTALSGDNAFVERESFGALCPPLFHRVNTRNLLIPYVFK